MTNTKETTLFDILAGVTHKKKEWSKWSESEQKKFAPFLVNRWLSMRPELIEVINELQRYTVGMLKPRDTYRLYHEILPTNKSFAKYIKGKKADKYNAGLIKQVADHYQVSLTEASDYVDMMNQDQCTRLLEMYGYQTKEIKQLIKGVSK